MKKLQLQAEAGEWMERTLAVAARCKQLPKEHEVRELMQSLADVIQYHEWRYYVQNDPLISDQEYDVLYHFLLRLEEEYPMLKLAGSPTDRVGSDISEEFPTVRHWSPMLSLANAFNGDDLRAFDKRVHTLCGLPESEKVRYHVEPKFDGGSVVLQYEEDVLTRGATRGNGEYGELITGNVRAMRSIPVKVGFSAHGLHRVELRGEVVISKDVFEQVNRMRLEAGETLLANARNAATGAMRVKDSAEVVRRGLEAFVYQIAVVYNRQGEEITEQLESHSASIALLKELGFKVPLDMPMSKTLEGIESVIAFCENLEEVRENLPYETDGVVIKVDRYEWQQRCGSTSHHPRWATALKFKARQATSRLLNVEFQVGKVGAVTPVAKIEPVQLAGVRVSSISLHNEEFIRSRDIRLGDTVLVERAGDVIPYVVKSFPELRTGQEAEIRFPDLCPSCQAPLQKIRDEAAWRCVNPHCEAQLLQKLIHFVSKDAMDIDGLGRQLVEKFYRMGILQSYADVFKLNFDRIMEEEGFGEKSVENLKAAIEAAKSRPANRLLYGLGIHHVGKRAAKILTAEVDDIRELGQKTEEELTAIKDIGPVVAANIRGFFALDRNVALLHQLEQLGVNLQTKRNNQVLAVSGSSGEIASKGAVAGNGLPLAGKSILFTGSLQQFTRSQAEAMAEQAGARVISAVSKHLDMLVAGEKAGSKLRKAEALGTVEIISEEEFLRRVKP